MRPSRAEDWPASCPWARLPDGRVPVVLRRSPNLRPGGGWTDAKPVTKTGEPPNFWIRETPAYFAFWCLFNEQGHMFTAGIEPADAITRNILRAETRHPLFGDLARDAIERACVRDFAWLDQADEDETPTLSRIEAAE